ncbi:MAG: glycosyltransferase [Methanobacterium sp.]|nr:glycosyltransferase [Methanobacterium sp.]
MYWIIIIFIVLLAAIKTTVNNKNLSVSVIIPAYNEEKTVGHVVKVVKSLNYIKEVIVVDDGSADQTSIMAQDAGAVVINHIKNRGKGAAIKTGFKNSTGDIVVFLDADIKNLTKSQVENIIQPIMNGEADITKTKFKREAGRVTELTAKPLLNFFFPEIKFDQPLSGQFAAKRSFLNKIKLEDDYGVDVGIVLDADIMGMKVKEVDIGKVDHVLSNLAELNIVATEVVRTIVDRATAYGRITIIDSLGQYIRMEILGLSLASFGIFALFFIQFISLYLALIITGIGIIIALYYIVKIFKISVNVFSRSEGNIRNLKVFLKMHSPIIVSILILLAMTTTILGSIHVDNTQISIQLKPRDLVLNPSSNQTIDLKGPYTIDKAFENEYTIIRIPKAAIETLELNYGDSIYINSQKYVLNQTRPGEDNIMRIPSAVISFMGFNYYDRIPDGDLRTRFHDFYAVKTIFTDNNKDLKITAGVIILNTNLNARTVEIFKNDQLINNSSGVFKNGTYSICVNGIRYKTFTYTENNPTEPIHINLGKDDFKIVIGGPTTSKMGFAPIYTGKFLNFQY